MIARRCSSIYYNDIDPHSARWLRGLIASGRIPPGDVDERSIADVDAKALKGYRTVHLFAGIGGWPYAIGLAGWPSDRPVWTGSCPCPPFSSAGKGQVCPVCAQAEGGGVGEAVPHPRKTGVFVCCWCEHEWYADGRHLWPEYLRLVEECRPPTIFGEQVASADGRAWLAGVRATLEALGYGVGAADLCAAGVGAPHIRQRLWWVAEASGKKCNGATERTQIISGLGDNGATSGLGDAYKPGSQGRVGVPKRAGERASRETGMGFWDAFDLLPCLDGVSRRVEPGTFPLAHGVPGRVGLLRGYGNAIVPELAAEFIAAYMETIG